ncbi:unnamed protein product [Allacma fusca]|uniref:Uncharacterized protein n=1 Tax=Allacma fusca TaxID=39272 RepID=A0A8J2KJL4_9HEXA|nr:unnamed protein product [Allacma fusca]
MVQERKCKRKITLGDLIATSPSIYMDYLLQQSEQEVSFPRFPSYPKMYFPSSTEVRYSIPANPMRTGSLNNER